MLSEMKHYKEADGFKIGDAIYIINGYDIEENTILDIYDDYYNYEDDFFICKYVRIYGGQKLLSKIFKERHFAEQQLKINKKLYDNYTFNK